MATDSEAFGDDPLAIAGGVLRIFDDLGVDAWVGGSLASSIYGVPRATRDADLVADLELDLVDAFVDRLGDRFYADAERIRHGVERRSSFNVIHLPTMFKVDVFLLAREPWAVAEKKRLRSVDLGTGSGILSVASPEDVVVHKLVWFRKGGGVSDRQWRDALGVLKVQGERLDRDVLLGTAADRGVVDLLEDLLEEADLGSPGVSGN